jgi:hypothetical protein
VFASHRLKLPRVATGTKPPVTIAFLAVHGAITAVAARRKTTARRRPDAAPRASQIAARGRKKRTVSRVRVASPQSAPATAAAPALPSSLRSRRSKAHHRSVTKRISDQKCAQYQTSSG